MWVGATEKGGVMKRFVQWAFNFAAAVSGLLFVATCVLWLPSYHIGKECRIRLRSGPHYQFHDFKSDSGIVTYSIQWAADWKLRDKDWRSYDQYPRIFTAEWEPSGAEPSESIIKNLGFDFGQAEAIFGGGDHVIWIAFPYWLLSILTGLLPAARITTFLRRFRRKRADRCLACGYDLRATPDRCPECGTVPARKAAT
jgi:hypothetical protein